MPIGRKIGSLMEKARAAGEEPCTAKKVVAPKDTRAIDSAGSALLDKAFKEAIAAMANLEATVLVVSQTQCLKKNHALQVRSLAEVLKKINNKIEPT